MFAALLAVPLLTVAPCTYSRTAATLREALCGNIMNVLCNKFAVQVREPWRVRRGLDLKCMQEDGQGGQHDMHHALAAL